VTPKQKIFAIIASAALIIFILFLIRRRRLKEEYALLWLVTAIGILILVIWYDLLEWLSFIIGAMTPTTTLFLFAFLFLIAIAIHFSIKFSKLSDQIKDITQELAFLRKRIEEIESLKPK
jgi:hypothetical protein